MRHMMDTFAFALHRIRIHRVLALWVLVGISVAVTLSLSLPLYVDSVYSELLESRLGEPPFSFRFRYLGAWNGNITLADVETTTQAIEGDFADSLGMPLQQNTRYLAGGALRLTSTTYGAVGNYTIGALSGAEDNINILDGEWPPVQIADDDPVPVLIPNIMWDTMGLQVGDELTGQTQFGGTLNLVVAARWEPVNENDPAWIFTPSFFDNVVLVPADVLTGLLTNAPTNSVTEVAWYLDFDGSGVRTADVGGLITQIDAGLRQTENVLPGIRQDISPAEGLTAFNQEVNALTGQLFIIIMPVAGLVMYFVSMVSGQLVGRQGLDDVKLRSRGMSRADLLGIHLLMWLTLVVVSLGIGLLVSPFVVRLVGQTAAFLRFDGTSSVQTITFTRTVLIIGVTTGLAAASSGLFLAWRTTRQNINSYRQQIGNARTAWWQRAYLDLILLVPAVYVYYSLTQQGGLTTAADEPFADPLTFIGPTLLSLGLVLVFLRFFPLLLRMIANALALTPNIALLMALREIVRSVGRYRGTLLMVAFTLSLVGYTASMAGTIDRSLQDSIDYRIGADMVLVTASEAETEVADDGSLTISGYNPPPVQELYDIDGVYDVARVGTYPGFLVVGTQTIDGQIMGVDRGAMAAVTRYREDFADVHLADLFNQLAGQRTGVLISRATAEQYNIAVGQAVTMRITALGEPFELRVPVAGYADYFPTLNPTSGFFLITNIDPIFELVGTSLPYDVWLALEQGADRNAVISEIQALNFPIIEWQDPTVELRIAQAEPARRGVLGFLSIGFAAAIVLTLIASVIQNVSSFRAQASQLGALRAMGLGNFTTGLYMILVQSITATSSILVGTGVGALTTLLFLPLLDFSGGLPPYLVRVAWTEIILVYVLFAGTLFTLTLSLTTLLSREQITTVVKLGE